MPGNEEETLKSQFRENSRREEEASQLLLVGLALEIVVLLVFAKDKPLIETILLVSSGLFVALGAWGEVRFSGRAKTAADELQRLSDERVAESNKLAEEANERAAAAELSRAELETKLLPRMLNQEQWNFIQGLRGQFSQIAVAFETDMESQWFAAQIRDAFFAAGISVAVYPRAPDVHTANIRIFEPHGFDGARARTVGPLVEIFHLADDPLISLAIVGAIPTDIAASIEATRPEMRAPLDTPMIIVGGRFVLPPPHLERAARMAKATRDAMRNAGTNGSS